MQGREGKWYNKIMLNIVALIALFVSVGVSHGWTNAVAATAFAWLVMPYQIVGRR